jgi:AraC-like DNA-binding protein
MLVCLLPLQAQTEAFQSKKDSFLHIINGLPAGEEKVTAYRDLVQDMFYNSDVDTALRYLEVYEKEALAAKSYGDVAMAIINRHALYCNVGRHKEGVARIPEDLAFLEKNRLWDRYYRIISIIITECCGAGEWDLAANLAKYAYDRAVQQGDIGGKVQTLYAIGIVYWYRGYNEEAAEYLQQSIELDKAHFPASTARFNTYMALVQTLMLKTEPEPEKALSLLKEWEKDINSGGFEDVEYYQILHMVYANYYTILDDWEKAEHYLNLLKNTSYEDETRNSWVRIYESRKDYPKMLEQARLTVEYSIQNKDTANIVLYMQNLAEAFSHLCQADSSIFYFYKADSIKNLVAGAERIAQIDELRTEYEVDKITAEKERNRNYFLLALGGCLLLSLTLGTWIYHSRQIVKKNRGLYRQIKEQDRLAAEQAGLAAELDKMAQRYESLTVEQKQGEEPPKAMELPGDRNQRILVTKLRELLMTERFFTQPDIDRDKLVTELGTNKTYIFEAVKAVTGLTLLEYINSLRLEEAKMMLEAQPELTIEAISDECGFGTMRTFYRLFREKYNLTPATYRRLARERK